MLTPDMKRIIEQQRLGFVATAAPDGTPNLSPKGTFVVLDNATIALARFDRLEQSATCGKMPSSR
jgi:predicted pyridoxine 5'-phosphate oxidase superfamily flavin-nucleotide-binding protein